MDQISKIGQIFLWNHEIAIADGDLKMAKNGQSAKRARIGQSATIGQSAKISQLEKIRQSAKTYSVLK